MNTPTPWHVETEAWQLRQAEKARDEHAEKVCREVLARQEPDRREIEPTGEALPDYEDQTQDCHSDD